MDRRKGLKFSAAWFATAPLALAFEFGPAEIYVGWDMAAPDSGKSARVVIQRDGDRFILLSAKFD